jgi:hypothetical protein
MATASFNDVFNTFELASMIMDYLSVSALLAISYTTKRMYTQVHCYLHGKLGIIFAPFGTTTEDVLKNLRLTNSLIIGSIALKAVAPTTCSITSSHLDILVHR